MGIKGKGLGVAHVVGLLGVSALTALALAMPSANAPERIQSAGHELFIPAGANIVRATLPDGRSMELRGDEGVIYLGSGSNRQKITLPERRRFTSITVMPGGQVLLWGGIDDQGRVLGDGDWLNPVTGQLIHANGLGLPARAGHTLSVLSDGRLVLAGGWTDKGDLADTVTLWQDTPRKLVDLPVGTTHASRIGGSTTLTADGSLLLQGGVDNFGHPVVDSTRLDPSASRMVDVSYAHDGHINVGIAASFPAKNSTDASIHGPLSLRFTSPVDVKQLANGTVTLLGPEGTVSARVVGTEGGRLAFVQLPDDLYPASQYTLFVKGLHTTDGIELPFEAIGFKTAKAGDASVVISGSGERPAPAMPQTDAGLPAMQIMAGAGREECKDDQVCRQHSYIKDGAWFPGRNNIPDFTGGHWRLYTSNQILPDTRAMEALLPKGATALVGQVRQIDESPVANVEISIGDRKVRTDARGVFVLADIPRGRQDLFVDGGSASHDAVNYGRFLVGADIKAHTVSHMPYVMYLPRVLPRDEVALPSPTTQEVVIHHPDMPGLELHVPAGAVFKDKDGHVLTHIAIVPTPVDHAPFPLPANFPMYFTIQPGDAVVQGLTPEAAKGIRVVYPNYSGAKPTSSGDFWVYNTKEGWQMYGQGHVTTDARHLAPDPGVALTMALGAGASENNTNPPTSQKPNNCSTGEPIDLQTGILFHEWNDLAIRDIVPLVLTRAYSSADISSHAFGIGGNANFGMHLYSSSNGSTFTSSTLVLPCGEAINFNLVSGSATWPFPAGTLWQHTATRSAYYGATMQFQFDTTAIGAHWLVTLKDGTQMAFTRHIPNSLSWIQDRYGNQVQFNYNGGLMTQMVSPSGRTINFNYDSSNRVTSATDNSGRTVGYAYNTAGSLATVTYPDQTTEQYTYDANHRMLTMQDRRGTVWVTNQYDANGRTTKQTYADNTSNQFAYNLDANKKVTSTIVTDPNGHQQQIVFDPTSGYPSSVTAAYGTSLAQTTTFVREASGLVDSATDALGRTTSYTYDSLGNVLTVTKLAGTANAVTTQFTYTSDYAQLASIRDPLGHVTQLSYTSGCLTKVTNPLGNATTLQCNAFGQPVAAKDAMGNTSLFAYQGYDLQSVTDPLNRTVSFAVDNLGRRIAVRDPMANVALTQYDVNDRVTSVIDALNQTTSITYDGNGNATSVTLPNQGVINLVYDGRNRASTRTDALKQSESWTYDGIGHVLTHTDRKGQTTDYSYDALNRRTLVAYADGSGTQASYDAGNRVTSLMDSAAGATNWTFDGLDRLTSEASAQGSVSYTYDAAGRRTSMTPAAQAIVNYAYDDANRLSTITQGTESVQFAYDTDNRRTTLTLPNGIVASYGYDQASQLTSLKYVQANGTVVGDLSYGYDSDGHRVSKGGSFATDTLPTPSTQPAVVDLNGRKTNFNGQTLSYDANGNLTSDGTNTYTWNARNQLVQISQAGAAQLNYGYDALGRRISKAVQGGAPVQYLYDGANAIQEVQGSIINPVLTGLGIDERFARNDVTGRTYFVTDAIGSTVGLTDQTGSIREQYSYDPYGNATLSDTSTGFTNPYQYTGREADSPGLSYYRARYYSPAMGGFISEDPLGFGGGQNSFYAYAHSNPVQRTDPMGLDDTVCMYNSSMCGMQGNVPPEDSFVFISVEHPIGDGGNISSGQGEGVLILGSSQSEGFYIAGIAAAGVQVGTDAINYSSFTGTEYADGMFKPITLNEGNVGESVVKIGGLSGGLGDYAVTDPCTGKKEVGVYAHVSFIIKGHHIAIGVGSSAANPQ
ncbi:RHS repeat-associated core domain-containing protein [Dyella japonica]|uniref:RHS repeat-associated protein n=1 Tax=Dyella japonica TaxID=231455 RepID=A0ABV2JYJ4_9GAMM